MTSEKVRLRSPWRNSPPRHYYVCGWEVDGDVPYLTVDRADAMTFRTEQDAERLRASCPDIADYEIVSS